MTMHTALFENNHQTAYNTSIKIHISTKYSPIPN